AHSTEQRPRCGPDCPHQLVIVSPWMKRGSLEVSASKRDSQLPQALAQNADIHHDLQNASC
ncbi:MAG: hypothetical protein Q8M47_06690, partial [Devosia sp.]|nr:hypothetical protein [Devosia sp.]